MTYASIMVHLDGSARATHRLEVAARLAAAQGCRLSGLFAIFEPDPAWFYLMEDAARYIEADRRHHHAVCDGVRRKFHEVTKALDLDAEWRETQGFPIPAVLRHVREADLVVAGQFDSGDPAGFIAPQFLETVVLEAGRPVLVVPHAGTFTSLGQRVVLAWNGSRESARALHDAVPLMTAGRVRVLCAPPPSGLRPDAAPASHAASALSRHGIAHEVEHGTSGSDLAVGEQLLSRAADFGADLIVMGAYGRGRLRELVLGGVTHTLLQSMTVPVLMSH